MYTYRHTLSPVDALPISRNGSRQDPPSAYRPLVRTGRGPDMLTIQELVGDNADKISLTWIAGSGAAHRLIPDTGRAAADLVGHLNLIHPSRIQVFGGAELSYYLRFEAKRRVHHLEEIGRASCRARVCQYV